MNKVHHAAVAEVHRRREACLAALGELRQRTAPLQLVEDGLSLLDPELTFIARLRQRMSRSKLLSFAVLAGAGWLTGFTRYPDGKPLAARSASPASPRAQPKEKNNDSGQQQRDQRPVHRSGRRQKGSGAEGIAQAEHGGRQARRVERQPRQRRGKQRPVEPQLG